MSSFSDPALPVPSSLIPYLTGELTDYSSVQSSVFIFNITFAALVAIAICLRMVVRFWIIRAAGLDDVLMIMAVVSAFVLFSACLAGVNYGLGNHIWNLDSNLLNLPWKASHLTKILFACYIAYATAITFTKCSIIASYIRLFPHENIRRISYATCFVVVSFWICHLFAISFACYPIQALWDWSITDAKCFPLVNFFYVAAAFNIFTDVTLCLLPIPTLWSLRMPRAHRIVVSGLFGVGLFACVASTMRLTQLHNLTGVDLSYQTVSSLNWSVAEVGTAIVCSCISVLRPLASKLFPNLFSGNSQPMDPTLNTIATTMTSIKSRSNRSRSGSRTLVPQSSSEDILELIHADPELSWPLP